jgi:hypothetical protein
MRYLLQFSYYGLLRGGGALAFLPPLDQERARETQRPADDDPR